MEIGMWYALPASAAESTLAQVNGRLAVGGLSITQEDARTLAERRAAALAETERVEFGTPAVVEVAGALVGSPCFLQQNVAEVLAKLQDAFYTIRDR